MGRSNIDRAIPGLVKKFQPSLRDLNWLLTCPAVETAGHGRASRCDLLMGGDDEAVFCIENENHLTKLFT